MDNKQIDERELSSTFRSNNHQSFFKFIERYEAYIAPYMRGAGYKRVNSSERTVLFTFGEVTFSRSRWYKKGKWRIPVDEKLGLLPNTRYSQELLYQIAKMATMVSYRQVVALIEMTYHIHITKDTVTKAVKLAADLLEERKDYRYYEETTEVKKIEAETIYIEGDGLHVKLQDDSDQKGMELSRFVIHTGVKKIRKNRHQLLNKKEITSTNNREAREEVLDYLYNHFHITDETILVTNSDGGKGYTPYVFKEIAAALNIKRHEHFWDEYHIHQDIKRLGQRYGSEISSLLFEAIKTHDRKQLRLAFDTMESLETDDRRDWLLLYRRKFLKNFQYTKSAKDRGLPKQGIGVMESQHRKLSYRMKHRGMYWTKRGANSLAQMIHLITEGKLRELFFGNWRTEYQKIKELPYATTGYLREVNPNKSLNKDKSIYRDSLRLKKIVTKYRKRR